MQFITGQFILRRLILLVAAISSSFIPTYSHAYDKDTLMQAFFSIVMIRGYDQSGGVAYGSGVVIGKDKVITNCHVFRQTNKPWIARGQDIYQINTVKADTWHDLCLVETDPMPFKPVQLGSTSQLKRGQEVVGFGHSNGSPAPLTSTGIIEGMHADYSGKLKGNVIRTTAKFLMGASGSGLFDLDGNLIGINTFKTAGKGGSIHFAVPVEWIKTLDASNNTVSFPVTGKALWEEDEHKKPFYMQAAVPESREDWVGLVAVAERWTASEPKSTDAWFSLGIALENIEMSKRAAAAFKKANELDPNHYQALVNMGIIAHNNGDKAEVKRIQLALADIDQDLAKQFEQLIGCTLQC